MRLKILTKEKNYNVRKYEEESKVNKRKKIRKEEESGVKTGRQT